MFRRRLWAGTFAWLAVGLICSLRAQEGPAPAPAELKVPVKQYKLLQRKDVYRAAIDGRQAHVRFVDEFLAQVPVPPAMARLTLGGYTHLPVIAFRTAGELVCLVPAANAQTVRMLLGVAPETPLMPAALQRPMVLRPYQQITIEGTVVGAVAGEKFVLVDAVLVGDTPRPQGKREVQIFWGTEAAPRVIEQPGEHTLTLPCSHMEGKTETVVVTVKSVETRALPSEVAGLTATLEGAPGTQKAYGQYTAGAVYRMAGGAERINVDFTDSILNILSGPLPAALATAPAVRGRLPAQVPIAFAFETTNRIVCLVPAFLPDTVRPGCHRSARRASASAGHHYRRP